MTPFSEGFFHGAEKRGLLPFKFGAGETVLSNALNLFEKGLESDFDAIFFYPRPELRDVELFDETTSLGARLKIRRVFSLSALEETGVDHAVSESFHRGVSESLHVVAGYRI